MVDKFIVYDVKTGETRIEEIEVPDIVEELEPIQPPTTEEKVSTLEQNESKFMQILTDLINK